MLQLENTRGKKLHNAVVFVEDTERAVCVVLYDKDAKAVDALRLETRDLDEALTLTRRWIRSRYIKRESLTALLAWVQEDHEIWTQILVGGHDIAGHWLGSTTQRKIPELQA